MTNHHWSHLWNFLILLVAVAALLVPSSQAFSQHPLPTTARNHHCHDPRRPCSSILFMALTPIGPFCPFRSAAATAMDAPMDEMQEHAPDFATEMTRFQLDLQMGQTPEPERLRVVANGLDHAVDQWETLVARLRMSGDFQTKEYAKLTEAHLNVHGQSVAQLGAMMKWQSACMRAMADNTHPPLPPPDIDLGKLMAEANNDSADKPSPSMSAMTAAEQITSPPFDDAKLDGVVKEEYEKLCRDHQSLIEFGAKYDTFDPLGKLAFLDQVEAIEERWDVFFTRFSLMGALNDTYIQQCNGFLQSMGMTEQDYRTLLRKSHEIMRQDAEAERSL
ncbi:Domain of unknown function (DUF1825) [Seminavis robusta]|uniref:Uncharacterized protein n=1 Tax=Seminavis robusta TaxID=568900 RepID=A0A9N8F182_9STRA|nr:Domain of unknown function (DUF1825) [Seminavis robusta]|eukprot:Sro2315_g322980.1 Domain of unknown function (DUF1825) (333) ;mRNA; r:11743-12741